MVGFRTICHRRQLLWLVLVGVSHPCLTRISVALLTSFCFRTLRGPNCKISFVQTVSFFQRCSQSSNRCAGSSLWVFVLTGVGCSLPNLSNKFIGCCPRAEALCCR